MNCQDCNRSQIKELGISKVKVEDYASDNLMNWCTDCGNYGVLSAMKRSLALEEIAPHEALICFDIGCHGNGADKMDGYRFHGLHGRVLPFAAGAAIGNPELNIIAAAGDGGTFSEGIAHFIQAVQNDYNFVFLLHNNSNYALTTGQASKTTRKGQVMSALPGGVVNEPMNPSEFALNLGASFVARGFSGDVPQLTKIIQAGLNHKGFSFIEILQACPTYNKATPTDWYAERVYEVADKKYDPKDLGKAKSIVADIYDEIATGVIYSR